MTAKAFKPAPDPKACTDYQADASQGADWRGWLRCATCRHWGKPGDPRDKRHTTTPAATAAAKPVIPRSLRRRPSAHVIAAAAAIEARRLGETGDDD